MGKGRACNLYLAGHVAALKNVCFVSKEGEGQGDYWVDSSQCLSFGYTFFRLKRDFLIEERLLVMCSL